MLRVLDLTFVALDQLVYLGALDNLPSYINGGSLCSGHSASLAHLISPSQPLIRRIHNDLALLYTSYGEHLFSEPASCAIRSPTIILQRPSHAVGKQRLLLPCLAYTGAVSNDMFLHVDRQRPPASDNSIRRNEKQESEACSRP